MNSILFTSNNSGLTEDELKYFKKAEKIIKKNNANYHKNLIIKIVLIILIIFVVFLCTIFSLINLNNDKILKNISVLGVDVSGLSVDNAKKKLNEHFDERFSTDIILTHNSESYILEPHSAGFSFNVEDVVNKAYLVGKSGNFFENNFTILNTYLFKKNITPELIYNDDTLTNLLEQMNGLFVDGVKQPAYSIDNTTLTITPGLDGYVFKLDELKKLIFNKLNAVDYVSDSIEIPIEMAKCNIINVEQIHNEVYKPAKNASYTTSPYHIEPAEVGIDFDISIDEANALITGDKSSYTIPLKYLYPEISNDKLSAEAFPDLLASYSTNYASSNSNRATNVALATIKINNTVVMPGETFSYNETVGKRTRAAGFKEAGAYAGGKVVTEVGGGICQVSSTLYNAVLRTDLEVVDRSNHLFQTGYVPIGTDATVSWGAPDFAFKNNRNYAIRIDAYTSNRNVYVRIYGLKQDSDCDIEILSYRTSSIAPKTTYTTDSSLAPGETKVLQNGSYGAKSVTYKIYKKNGEEISRVLISEDRYEPHNKVVAVGK